MCPRPLVSGTYVSPASKKAKKAPGFIHNRKGAEGEFFLFDEIQNIADFLIGMDLDWLANQAMDMVFDPGNFGKLLPWWHVIMN